MSDELSARDLDELHRAFVRVSARGWGIALGLLAALGLFAATTILVVKGGPDAGAHLGLLANYFPGFDISIGGAAIGAFWAFLVGYVAGWTVGTVYNVVVERSA